MYLTDMVNMRIATVAILWEEVRLSCDRNLPRLQQQNNSIADKLRDFIGDGRVIFLGAVRQEILSGIKHQAQYEREYVLN